MLIYLTSSYNNQAAEAEAAREARAKVDREIFLVHFYFISNPQVIAAEGEQKASKSLAEASKVMSETGAALQLRYLQVLRSHLDFSSISNLSAPLRIILLQTNCQSINHYRCPLSQQFSLSH